MQVTFEDIRQARERIAGQARVTPVLQSIHEDGTAFYYKCENLQRGGAFKFRGAFNKISTIPEERRQYGVVTFSSGNHARAVATAARLLGMHAKIVMPKDAPPVKIEATRSVGAEIVFYDRYTEDREAIGRAIAEEEKRTLVPPFDDPMVVAGQGTIGLELHEQCRHLDYVVAPIGGGGLISGTALALSQVRPQVTVIGAEAESANDTYLSLQKGERVEIPVPRTIADGMQVTCPGEIPFAIIRKLVRDVVLVSEMEIVQGMRFVAEQVRQIVEPTAAVAVAAARKISAKNPAAHIAIILSGGNIDQQRYLELMTRER